MCDAGIRPFFQAEIHCGLTGEHSRHQGALRDYAYPGSQTIIEWDDMDRRTFRGEYPGPCPGDSFSGCILPLNHRGTHAS